MTYRSLWLRCLRAMNRDDRDAVDAIVDQVLELLDAEDEHAPHISIAPDATPVPVVFDAPAPIAVEIPAAAAVEEAVEEAPAPAPIVEPVSASARAPYACTACGICAGTYRKDGHRTGYCTGCMAERNRRIHAGSKRKPTQEPNTPAATPAPVEPTMAPRVTMTVLPSYLCSVCRGEGTYTASGVRTGLCSSCTRARGRQAVATQHIKRRIRDRYLVEGAHVDNELIGELMTEYGVQVERIKTIADEVRTELRDKGIMPANLTMPKEHVA